MHAPSETDLDAEGVAENIRHLLPLVSQSDQQHYSNSKRVRHLNQLAKVIKYCGHVIDPYYPVERVIENVRLALVSSVKEVRAGALRVLRYLLHSKEIFSIMMRLRIDILVVRSLDVPASREIERLQAVRFVRQVIMTAPSLFPVSLAAPLVSIVLYDSDPLDNLTWSATATLCELALLNPEVAAGSGGIKAILKGLLKCQTLRISESIVLTLNYLLNRQDSRRYVRSHLDLESLLAPITDLHYRCLIEETNRSVIPTDLDMRVVQASKMAVVSMLKSWPGLFCLCSPHNTGLSSLLSMLPLAQTDVQREILDILYSVFQLKVPTWTDNFQEALASVDPVQPKSEWSFTEGFVVEEGKDLLPPKYGSRTNLVDCFHALLLAVLIEEGVFECFVEVVRTANNRVRVMTTILMGQLLHMANSILPSEFSSDTHCLSDLITSAMDFDTDAVRNRATEVISFLDRVHQQKKEGVKPSSPYLRLILEQARYATQPKQEQELLKLIPSEMEDGSVLALVRDTDVPAVPTKEYMKWKWSLIFSVLQHPSIGNQQVMEDATFGRFIKRLCNFFKPSGHLFSMIRFSEANQKKFSTVGKLLVKFLCCIEENFSSHLVSLLTDIVDELSQVTASKVTADVFSASSVANKLARDYFLLLGTTSFLRPALMEQCKAYGPLLDICNYQNRTDLMKLMLSTLDFGNIHCRVILSKLLTSTDKEMRLYATRHMRVLLRAKMPFFNSWGLELLVPQLYDLERQVALEVVEILDEACEEENFLEALLLQQPALLHLGEKGAAVFTRFISIRRGFALLQKLMLFESLVDRWYSMYSKLYVYIVEEKLAEAITSFKIVEEGQFIRRTDASVSQPEAFVPVHFYGQIVQHEEGCAMLDKMGHVKKFCETIQLEMPTTKEDVTAFKAAIWALGHIGSTQQGLELLLSENAVDDLIDLAEECPLLSIRGTCYYALCLISKTKAGANVLLENNWITVRHSAEEKWPLIFDSQQELDETTPLSPDPHPIRFFPPLFGSFDLDSLPRRSRLPKASSDQVLNTPYSRADHLGSSLSLSIHSTSLTRRAELVGGARKTPPPPRVLGVRKPGRKLFASVKDRGRRSPSLSRIRGRSVADITRGHMQTLGQSRLHSTSTGELLSPDILHKTSSPLSQHPSLPQPLQRVTSVGQPHRSRSSPTATFFIGVCIPIDISTMFEYAEEEYRGFRTHMSAAPNFEGVVNLPHDPARCLECSLTHQEHTITSSSSSLHQHNLLAGPTHSSGGSHATDTSSTAGSAGGSYVSKDKSLDATPSPDAPRTLHLHVGSSQENVTDGGDSSDGGGAKGVAVTTPSGRGKEVGEQAEKESSSSGKKPCGSPLVRMKQIGSQELERRDGSEEKDVKWNGENEKRHKREKDHTSSVEEGREKDHTSSVGEGREKDHTSSVGEGREKDHTSSVEEGREKDHTSSVGEGREKDHTSSVEEGREKDHTSSVEEGREKDHSGSVEEGREKDHTSSVGEGREKDHTSSVEEGREKDHSISSVEEGREKDHSGSVEEGREKDHTSSVEEGREKDHTGSVEEGREKDHTGSVEEEREKDHSGSVEEGREKDHTSSVEEGRGKDHTGSVEEGREKDHTGSVEEGREKDHTSSVEEKDHSISSVEEGSIGRKQVIQVGEEGRTKEDSGVIRLTPPLGEGDGEGVEEIGGGDEEEEEGMTTEDETDDDELDEEMEEEGEIEERGDDSISPVKEILINVVSASTGGERQKKDSSVPTGGGAEDTASVSSVVTMEEASGRQALHKAVLEIVYSLSSDVSLKKNSQGLNQVCQKYTELGDDLCLYSKVVDMLSSYHYNLLTRRFIQSKFQHMTYDPLFASKSSMDEATFAEEDLVSSSAASSRRDSYCSGITEAAGEGGRRSSTSDALRFRRKMRQASSHESHEEIPNHGEGDRGRGESTSSAAGTTGAEGENNMAATESPRKTEPEIMITAASASSQESSGTPTARATTSNSRKQSNTTAEVGECGRGLSDVSARNKTTKTYSASSSEVTGEQRVGRTGERATNSTTHPS